MPTRRCSKNYTPAERAHLTSIYATASQVDLLAAFPGRSLAGLRSVAGKMGLSETTNYWSPAEDAVLIARYAQDGPQTVAKLLKRSPQAVKGRAARLKVHMTQRVRRTRAAIAAATEHSGVPKAKNTLKPLAVGVQKDAVKRSPGTPNLNAAKDARLRQEKAKGQSVTEDIKRLAPDSEGRRVYAQVAARQGGTAATAAFREWQAQQHVRVPAA